MILFLSISPPQAYISQECTRDIIHEKFTSCSFPTLPFFQKGTIQVRIPTASIIRLPPSDGKTEDPSYGDLLCTEKDRENISFLIRAMSENGKLGLLFRKGELNRIGAEINHVHPLKFLDTIFSSPELKQCMPNIENDYFKWNGLMDGLGPSLSSKADQGKLDMYLDEFAKTIGVTREEIEPFVKPKDWQGLVRYLSSRPDSYEPDQN